jgi:hypothetical protein
MINPRRLPAPQVQAIVACRKIINDPQMGEIVITGSVSHWRAVLSGRQPLPLWEWRKGEKQW